MATQNGAGKNIETSAGFVGRKKIEQARFELAGKVEAGKAVVKNQWHSSKKKAHNNVFVSGKLQNANATLRCVKGKTAR